MTTGQKICVFAIQFFTFGSLVFGFLYGKYKKEWMEFVWEWFLSALLGSILGVTAGILLDAIEVYIATGM